MEKDIMNMTINELKENGDKIIIEKDKNMQKIQILINNSIIKITVIEENGIPGFKNSTKEEMLKFIKQMKKQGLTQNEIACLCNISQSYISVLINNNKDYFSKEEE